MRESRVRIWPLLTRAQLKSLTLYTSGQYWFHYLVTALISLIARSATQIFGTCTLLYLAGSPHSRAEMQSIFLNRFLPPHLLRPRAPAGIIKGVDIVTKAIAKHGATFKGRDEYWVLV